jgi:purine-binding chemotaxis protein CheW
MEDLTKQYIQFKLGEQDYVIEMLYVREIIKPVEITKLLGSPNFVQGVTKLRDKVLTIISLHKKFKIMNLVKGEPRIIIFEFGNEKIGLIVDEVVEIIETNHIEKIPSFIHHGIIHKLIKLQDNIIPILDVEILFSNEVATWLNLEENEAVSNLKLR